MPNHWWQRKPNPKDIEPYPWLGPAVVERLEGLLERGWSVVEHGSGGSTLWFAGRVKSVTAYESNSDWYAVVKDQAPANARVVNRGLYRGDEQADLLLIDGEPVGDRAAWAMVATQIVRPGGWVVLDNCTFPQLVEARAYLREIAAEYETIDCNVGGSEHQVTEFYRLHGVAAEPVPSEPAEDAPKPKRRKKKTE